MDSKYYATGPGFAGFVVTFAIAVALILLYRSMSRHLRKVRLEAARDEAAAAGPDAQAQGAQAPDAQAQAATTLGRGVEDGDGGGDVVADPPGNGQ